jgi:hypothetical protein
VCFFEEWGHSSLERLRSEERSGQERSQTILRTMSSWVVSKRASSSRAGPTREGKKNAFRLFLFFQERETERAKVGKSRSEMCHGVHLGNPHGLLVGVFGRSREMNDARRVPRQKKSTRASLHGKGVEREARPRDAPRRTPRHARIARARDTRSRRSLVSWLSVPRGFHTHLSTDRARRRDCRGSRDAFLARPTLARSVARFLRTRFRLANSEDAAVRRR